jgi:hypothetical protein
LRLYALGVQHILYDVANLQLLARRVERGLDTTCPLQLLFVLGRYTVNQQSTPSQLIPFTQALARLGCDVDWAVCAFFVGETEGLLAAHESGGN